MLMKRKNLKKMCAVVLSMVFVLAQGVQYVVFGNDSEVELDISEGSITITANGYTQGEQTTETAHTGSYFITQSNPEATGHNITVSGGTIDLTIDNLYISCTDTWAMRIMGGESNISFSGENVLISGQEAAGYAGLQVDKGAVVNLSGSTENSSLYCKGGSGGAGIGSQGWASGVTPIDAGTINICSGKIVAESIQKGAGIGGGHGQSFDKIQISGGDVTAVGNEFGAGIGSSTNSNKINPIIISGGIVHATGGSKAAAIGGGGVNVDSVTETNADIKILGGSVFANTSSVQSYCIGAGFGEGSQTSVVIENATVSVNERGITGVVKNSKSVPVYKTSVFVPYGTGWADIKVGNGDLLHLRLDESSKCCLYLPAGENSITASLRGNYKTKNITVTDDNLASVVFADALNAPANPHFSGKAAVWDMVPDATAYLVSVFKDGNFLSKITTKTTHKNMAAVMTEEAQYSFQVQALGNGIITEDSELSGMSAVYNNSGFSVLDEIFVSAEEGLIGGDGTADCPFREIEDAQEYIRAEKDKVQQDVTVYLDGTFYYGEDELHHRVTKRQEPIYKGEIGSEIIDQYEVETALRFDENDMVNDGYNKVIYKNVEGKTATLSGGKRIGDWTLYDAQKNIWKANVGDDSRARTARQLYVNGKRATRARTEGSLAGLSFSKNGQMYTSDKSLQYFKNLKDVEIQYYREWCSYTIGVSGITKISATTYRIDHDSEAWEYATAVTSSQTKINSTKCFMYLENALEVLDAPSEFYIDKESGDVYYMPMEGEDMRTAEVVVPIVDELIHVEGASVSNPVRNIEFNGLQIEHSTWLRPNGIMGHLANQSNTIRNEGGGIKEGAIQVLNARNVDVIDCTLKNIGNTGIMYQRNIQNCNVVGNTVTETAGNGIVMGDPSLGYGGNEEVSTNKRTLVKGCNVSNNYLKRIGLDYYSSTGIVGGFLQNCTISNNDIIDIAYSGISVGWHNGGSDNEKENVIANNRIINVMTSGLEDGGAIYHLGKTAGNESVPGYTVKENYVKNQMNSCAILYLDNSSSWITCESNVIDQQFCTDTTKMRTIFTQGMTNAVAQYNTIKNNYFTGGHFEDGETNKKFVTGNGAAKTNTYSGNVLCKNADFPQEALDIINRSGLSPQYSHLRTVQEPINLNPGFEFTTSARVNLWRTTDLTFGRTHEQKHSGTYGAKLTLGTADGILYIPVKMNFSKRYRTSVFLKTQHGEGTAAVSVKVNGVMKEIAHGAVDSNGYAEITGNWMCDTTNSDAVVDTELILSFSQLPAGTVVYADDFYVWEEENVSFLNFENSSTVGGKISGNAFYVNDNREKNLMLILSLYDKNNKLLSTEIQCGTVPAKGIYEDCISIEQSNIETKYAKLFLWEKDRLMPLIDFEMRDMR